MKLMGFEPWTFCAGTNRSTNLATTTAFLMSNWNSELKFWFLTLRLEQLEPGQIFSLNFSDNSRRCCEYYVTWGPHEIGPI